MLPLCAQVRPTFFALASDGFSSVLAVRQLFQHTPAHTAIAHHHVGQPGSLGAQKQDHRTGIDHIRSSHIQTRKLTALSHR